MDRSSSRIALASLAAVCVLTLWRALGGPDALYFAVGAACAALIAADFARVSPGMRRMVGTLFALSVLVLPFLKDPQQALARGVFLGGLLVSLVGAVTLIARCADRSPQLRALGERLRAQPPRRRYFAFTMASQVFSAMLSLAGTNLLFIMASDTGANGRGAPMVSAITRGFSAAIFWSPMFGNMAILLALYPSLSWAQVFPLGLLMAQLVVLVGVLMQRRNAAAVAVPRQESDPAPARNGPILAPLLVALGLFFAGVLSASTVLGISITASIVLCALPVTYLLDCAMAPGGGRWAQGARTLVHDLRTFPSVASEAALFIAAGCSGTLLAEAFPDQWALWIGSLVGGSTMLAVSALMLALMALSVIGIHPVLTAVFLASTFTPVQLGLTPLVHFCAILTGWGLAASLTPFSVLSMSASRYSGMGIYRVSLGENWRFAAVCTLLAVVVLGWAAAPA